MAELMRQGSNLTVLHARATRAMEATLDAHWNALDRASDLLSALSYHGVLARGFALVRGPDGQPIRLAARVAAGAALDIEFADGRVAALASGPGLPAAQTRLVRPRRRRAPDPGQGSLFG